MVCSMRCGVWKTATTIWEEDILHVRGGVGRGLDGAAVSFVNKKHTYPTRITHEGRGDFISGEARDPDAHWLSLGIRVSSEKT